MCADPEPRPQRHGSAPRTLRPELLHISVLWYAVRRAAGPNRPDFGHVSKFCRFGLCEATWVACPRAVRNFRFVAVLTSLTVPTIIAIAVPSSYSGESCKLGKSFAVMNNGEVESDGWFADWMEKSGTVNIDLKHMRATYALRIAYHLDTIDTVESFEGSARLHRATTKPDEQWICPQPKCPHKEALDALLRHLNVEPSTVDTVEHLAFVVKPQKAKLTSADGDLSEPQAHEVVRFLSDGKADLAYSGGDNAN